MHEVAEKIINAFGPKFFDEAACRRFLLEVLYPNGPECRKCGNREIRTVSPDRFLNNQQVRCYRCGLRFSPMAGTVLHSMNLTPPELILSVFLADLGFSTPKIGRIIGRRRDAVRFWMKRLELWKAS